MKQLHREDLLGWSQFNEERDLDFHSVLWVRPEGNVAIDPLPLIPHDRSHIERLGGVAWIVVTNSDHVRAAADLAAWTGARIAGPSAEADTFPLRCDRWLRDGDCVVAGLRVFEMQGSKTPGELALWLEPDTLITGDLVRCHRAGWLCLLPDTKLRDPHQARQSVARLLQLPRVDAVLVGDGWPVFRDGRARLEELWNSLQSQQTA
jgi:glyoxylase-like metal-dependent hydrolase (beta-lactamase superfamily II)